MQLVLTTQVVRQRLLSTMLPLVPRLRHLLRRRWPLLLSLLVWASRTRVNRISSPVMRISTGRAMIGVTGKDKEDRSSLPPATGSEVLVRCWGANLGGLPRNTGNRASTGAGARIRTRPVIASTDVRMFKQGLPGRGSRFNWISNLPRTRMLSQAYRIPRTCIPRLWSRRQRLRAHLPSACQRIGIRRRRRDLQRSHQQATR
jgi:hypothetical protein